MLGNGPNPPPRVRLSALALAISTAISIGAVISGQGGITTVQRKGHSFQRVCASPPRLPPDRLSRH